MPVPAWSEAGAAPNLGVWHDLALEIGGSCPQALDGPMELVLALATRFRHDGGVAELAERIGAISDLEGLPYWSVSDGRWRPLISVSHAIASASETDPRPDFSAAEVLSGRTLYTAQRDTRSHGLNVYALQATSPSEDQLIVTITNVTSIRFLVATLFEPQALVSTVIFTRIRGNEWGYYALTVTREGSLTGREASLINRAAAFERFHTGKQPDGAPPLAPD
jgi:hypothetical protein